MFFVIWEYKVKPEQSGFESIYSPNGAWAELFNRGEGYLGTELFRDQANRQHYLTIDRWRSKDEYDAFLDQHEKEYKALDAQCEGLTESESLLGRWETI
ncbi:MAG TPA: antibiotic biosynthesis monooxygenase [Anaerolineales bacterium]|nr:antibiotic biosynthesis monooxygenase [Anaerolineales bacterium]